MWVTYEKDGCRPIKVIWRRAFQKCVYVSNVPPLSILFLLFYTDPFLPDMDSVYELYVRKKKEKKGMVKENKEAGI